MKKYYYHEIKNVLSKNGIRSIRVNVFTIINNEIRLIGDFEFCTKTPISISNDILNMLISRRHFTQEQYNAWKDANKSEVLMVRL